MIEQLKPPFEQPNRDLPRGTRLLFAIFALVMITMCIVIAAHERRESQDSCRLSTASHGLACTVGQGVVAVRRT